MVRTQSNPHLPPVVGPDDVTLAVLVSKMDDVKKALDESRAETKLLEKRIQDLETKVAMVRGMWIAVGITTTLLGAMGVIFGILVSIKRVFGVAP